MFWACVKQFTHSKFKGKSAAVAKEDRVETLFSIPYIGLFSVVFGRKIRESFKTLYGIDVGAIFPWSAVLLWPCWSMSSTNFNVYMMWIRLTLATKVKEHAHFKGLLAISDHVYLCVSCQSNYSVSLFKVIDTARNDLGTPIKESLHIKHSKPSLNKQLLNTGSSYVLLLYASVLHFTFVLRKVVLIVCQDKIYLLSPTSQPWCTLMVLWTNSILVYIAVLVVPPWVPKDYRHLYLIHEWWKCG